MKSESNRQRIIQAAMTLFHERGYAETSIADIAEQAGLLKGNLAYYFKTKTDLLKAVVHARQDEVFGNITAQLKSDATGQEGIEQFLQMVESQAPNLAQVGCPVGTLSSELGKNRPELHTHAASLLQNIQDWLTQQFAQFSAEPNAHQHAEHLLSLLQGASVLAHASHDPEVIFRQTAWVRKWLQGMEIQETQHQDSYLQP